ncbi:HprK-related kinase A [Roseateles violae]|uniref:HprK-related kinase A n=1 Tax=Roseateles violae TaxID=3058042 RepID=A0ABT8DT30_9BURK|nr:HprK-related kinase A [Pelomonas sp. PFR6]MDN3919517.1 HprK-related kinase A [Pelomonas sp. PFR6]
MKLGELSARERRQRLAQGELVIRAGPFRYRIESRLAGIEQGLALLYADYPLAEPDEFADFSLKMEEGAGLHRWWRRQVRFSSDGVYPFEPLPQGHAYAQLEWAMNWCVSTQAHHYLMLHAAVVEREGFAAILPAPPGSGKSTLCAALVHRGWRLLSDELALISLDEALITPAVRPIGLKNQSIPLLQAYAPEAVLSPVTHGTSKGSVAHLRVPGAQLARMDESARPRWVVFPKYVAGAAPSLQPQPRGRSMLDLGANSFNYTLLGLQGFEALARVVSACDCYRFDYSRLDDAIAVFDQLARAAAEAGHG